MKSVAACLMLALCLAPSAAFTAMGKAGLSPATKALTAKPPMTMALDVKKAAAVALGAAPVAAAQAVIATEGTGEAWGIDDNRLTFVLAAGFTFVFFLFSGWASNQDSDDFFDSIDRRSSK